MSAAVLPQIEAALSRQGRGLAFAPELEAVYEAMRGPQRNRDISRCLAVTGICNVLLLLCDAQARVPISLALWLRIGFFTPVTLTSVFLLTRTLPLWLQGWIAVTPMIAFVAVQTSIARCVGPPLNQDLLVGAGLAIFAQVLIAPVPFLYALRGVAISLAVLAMLCLAPIPGRPSPKIPGAPPTFIALLACVGLSERYRRERAGRRDFLLCESNRLHIEGLRRANKQLERLSTIDSLTGIFNRRYLDAALSRHWIVACDHERWLGVLMIDIDSFKQLNDSAGHQHGDFCLEEVGRLLQGAVRAGVDTVARYGGEEFVAVLPDANEAEVMMVGERVRQAIEAAALPTARGHVLTVSVGAAAIQGGASSLSLAEFMASADRALYEAKHAGRNRVISAGVCV